MYETFEEARDRLLQDGIDIERMPQLADLRAEEEAVLDKIARESEALHGVIEGEVVEASGDADAPVKEPDTAPAPDGPKKPTNNFVFQASSS